MVVTGQQEKLAFHSPSLQTREEGKADPFRRKLAFASCSPARANQTSKFCLSQGPWCFPPIPSLLSPGMELSCPEPGPGSLLRHRGLGGGRGRDFGRIQDLRDTLPIPFPDWGHCNSYSTEAFWRALASGKFRPKDGTTLAPPLPLGKFCQIGKAEEGAVPAVGCGSIKPHLLTPGQSVTTLGSPPAPPGHSCSQNVGKRGIERYKSDPQT